MKGTVILGAITYETIFNHERPFGFFIWTDDRAE